MKTLTALLLFFATSICLADDANTSGKKAEKKAKPAAKSDKNFAQRAESLPANSCAIP